MIIRLMFAYYKECPIYYKLLEEAKQYRGEHQFQFRIAQGSVIHDVRNVLIAECTIIPTNFVLPEFDVGIMVDSDCVGSLEDAIYLAETDYDIIGLPYMLRGSKNKYNAGFILKNGFDHLPVHTSGMMEVHGQGNGFKAIKKKVFEAIPPCWFWPEIITFEDGSMASLVEDWAFDRKARKAGFRVWCNFDRPVKHNPNQGAYMTVEDTSAKQPPQAPQQPQGISLMDLMLRASTHSTKATTSIQELTSIVTMLVEVVEQQNKRITELSNKQT